MPFKEDEQRLLNWYQSEIEALKVEIHLNQEVTPTFVREKKPDAAIVATGSKSIALNVPGADKGIVTTACDFLVGKKKAGERAVVVGGGQVGCEIALWLARQGKKVTITEKLGDLLVGGRPIPWMNRVMLLDLLKFHKVNVLTHHSLFEVTDGEAVVIDKDLRRSALPADMVIMAVGLKEEQEIYLSLRGHFTDLYLIGDARKAWNVMNAVWEAYEVARSI